MNLISPRKSLRPRRQIRGWGALSRRCARPTRACAGWWRLMTAWMLLWRGIDWRKWPNEPWMCSITSGRMICPGGYCYLRSWRPRIAVFTSGCCLMTTIRLAWMMFYASLTPIRILRFACSIPSHFARYERWDILPISLASTVVCTIKALLPMVW